MDLKITVMIKTKKEMEMLMELFINSSKMKIKILKTCLNPPAVSETTHDYYQYMLYFICFCLTRFTVSLVKLRINRIKYMLLVTK
jgi:hypothetical protein